MIYIKIELKQNEKIITLEIEDLINKYADTTVF